MKSIFNYMATLVLCIFATASHAQKLKKFRLNGQLVNIKPMPDKIYLKYDELLAKPVDSAMVRNGKYSFEGQLDAAMPATLSYHKVLSVTEEDKMVIFLDEGLLEVVSDKTLKGSKVSGSGSGAYHDYLSVTSYSSKESAEIKEIMDSERYKTDETLKKETTNRSMNLLGKTLMNMIAFVKEHPNSPASPYFTYALMRTGFVRPEMIDTLNQGFPAELRKSKMGLEIDAYFAKRLESEKAAAAANKALDDLTPIGSMAKDFTQNDVSGKPVNLASFKGKYVLIDFWASWCGPCRAENPLVVKAYNTYKSAGFEIIGVSLDGEKLRQDWIDAIAKDQLTWTQVSDLKGFQNAAAELYGVKAIPQNFLIDPNGIIVAKNLRGDALQKKLSEIFEK